MKLDELLATVDELLDDVLVFELLDVGVLEVEEFDEGAVADGVAVLAVDVPVEPVVDVVVVASVA